MTIKALRSVAALSGAMALGGAALACTQPPNPPAPPTIHIEQMGPNTFCIWICNYTAAGAQAGTDFCLCAINKLGVIQSVKSVEVYSLVGPGGPLNDPCTGGRLTPLFPQPWDFEGNPNTGLSFANFAGEGDWEGLLAFTTQNIQQQVPITIKITVNLVSSRATLQDLVNAMQSGNPPFIGTAKGNPDGTIMMNPMHPPAVLPAGMINIIGGAIPTLSEWGLIVCGVLMLGGGAVALRWFGRAV